MGNLDKEGLDDVFLNVRKAYRLLFEYQTKVKKLVKFIGNYFSYTSTTGYSLFSSNSPNNGKKLDLDSWAWDWLNMYVYEFHFGNRKIQDKDVTFSIRLYSDTGWYDKNTDRSTRTKIETFETSKKSKTKLVLFVGKEWKDPFLLDVSPYVRYTQ